MQSKEIIQKYLDFYKDKGHKLIPNVSLVPKDDPTLLFVNSGVFPLVPYVFGEKHPEGKRLMNVQRCVRFDDLENVGDSNRHTIAFHMIGNWSLGDYFKKEQLPWIWEFYVEILGLDINKLYATVFAGDKDSPKDMESVEIIKEIYKKYGIEAKENEKIFAYTKEGGNWWQRGEAIGEPGGPSSETFYYIGKDGNGEGKNPQEFEDEFIEIGNSVFMQYKKGADGWEMLEQNNVDFGGGLERLALASQGKQDIFETDNFWPIIEKIEELTGKKYQEFTKEMRVIADHMRSSVFIAMDGVLPSNKDQGYMLRRLLRRLTRMGLKLGFNSEKGVATELVDVVCDNFEWIYPSLKNQKQEISSIFAEEEKKFSKVLREGQKEILKASKMLEGNNPEASATLATSYYVSSGYPLELALEDFKDQGLLKNPKDEQSFHEISSKILEEHKELSRQGAAKKFEGGLADQGEQTIRYHTATHLLHWALRQALGDSVQQMGSNITGERLRFDFTNPEKLTETQLNEVENLVNQKIKEDLPVNFEILPKEKAEKSGALHFFNEKYGENVKVYFIGDSIDTAFSKEFCGGPHVKSTGEIENISLYKQEKIGKSIVRIYAR